MKIAEDKNFAFKKYGFPAWLLITYLALIPGIITGGFLFYKIESQQLQKNAEESIQLVGQLKVDQIAQWRSERMGDAYLIMNDTEIDGQDDLSKTGRSLLKKFSTLKNYNHYSDILFTDPTGRVLLHTGNNTTVLPDITKQALVLAFTGHKPVFADLHFGTQPSNIPQLDIAVPLYNSGGNSDKPVAGIILCMDARQYLYPFLQMWPVPARTPETLLVRREGDSALFLNEIRHQKNSALKFALPLTDKKVPAVMAVLGKEGIIQGIDYRGKSVIAMLRHIPDSPWFLVAKVDTDEAFAVVGYRSSFIFAITLLLLVSVLTGSALFWKHKQTSFYQALYQSEFEKRALQKHFKYLIKYANDIIILCDANLQIVEINDRALEEYGYSRDEITGMVLYDLIAEDDYNPFYDRLNELKVETSYLREGIHKRKDGTLFNVEVSGRYIEVDGTYYFQGIIRNITERKRIEEELKQAHDDLHIKYNELKASEEELATSFEEIQSAEEELAIQNEELRNSKERAEESDRLKTAFLQNMSHEIRTPMNAIVGFSQLMEENLSNPLKIKEFSKIISHRSNDLLSIIDEILEVSRIETGQIQVKEQNCDINHMLDELHSFFSNYKGQIGKSHIELGYKKISGTESTIVTDTVKFKQILINLLQNALKYTHRGSIEFGFERVENGNLVFFVSDTGIGIPHDKFALIFDRFMQIDPGPETIKEGLGLGLSIAKGLVTLLGGKIWLKSEVNRGSVFYFTIPMIMPSKENESVEISMKPANFWKQKTFLIVEDDSTSRMYYSELFSEKGARIIFVTTGKEAIDLILLGSKIDLILMDIRLPDMNGFEVTKKIKAIKPHIPIIAQTAFAMASDREQSIAAGCDGYIAKPVFAEELFSLISDHFSS